MQSLGTCTRCHTQPRYPQCALSHLPQQQARTVQHQQQQQQQQQQRWCSSRHRRAAAAACASSQAFAASTERPQQHQHQHQQQQQDIRLPAELQRGRLLIKQRTPQQQSLQRAVPHSLHELRGPYDRGATDLQQQQQQDGQLERQQPNAQQQQPPHNQQQQQQQQPARLATQQSLRDKNLSFSGALKHARSLPALLQLLDNPQWGQQEAFNDLDAVSVVGALVWLVKSSEWQQLQQQGSAGQQQWQAKQAGLQHIKALCNRAEQLVTLQSQASSSSSSSVPSAAAAAAVPLPVLIRPAELANLIYCCSKLGQHRPQLLAAAAAGLQLDLYACSTLELQRLIWGLAHARVNPGDAWLLSFCKAAQAKLFGCSPAQLSVLVYGVARLGYRPPDVWVGAWLEASVPVLGSMSPQQLANSAWGLSCFRFQAPPGWLSAFYAATSASLTQQAPQGFSQLAVALLTLAGGEAPPQDWTQQLLEAVQPQLPRLELLQLCNLGKALANWGHQPDEGWMAGWMEASGPLLPAATPIDLSVLLWSCYKLSYVPQQRWLEVWFAATAASLPRCEPQQLATMALVLGEWGLVPTPGFSIDFWRASRARFPEFTPYQMSVLLWGLAKARRAVPTTWATAILAAFTQQLPSADPGDVCRFVGALGGVVVKPRGSAQWVAGSPAVQQQLQQVVAWLVPQLGEVQPAWLMQLVSGLVKLRCGLRVGDVDGVNDAAARMDERLAPAQRRTLAGGFKLLRELAQQQPAVQLLDQQQQQQQGRQQAGSSSGEWLPEQLSQEADILW